MLQRHPAQRRRPGPPSFVVRTGWASKEFTGKTNMAIATKTPKPRVRIHSALVNCFFGRNGGKVRSYAGMAPKNSLALMSPGFTDIAQAARLDSPRRARRGTSVILASAST